MNDTALDIFSSFLGAALQELLYWYDARAKLSLPKYSRLIKSPAYWAITILMAIGSACGCYVWFHGTMNTPATYLIAGAAFPLFLKKAVSAFLAKKVVFGSTSAAESRPIKD
jgi:hypothetical protein